MILAYIWQHEKKSPGPFQNRSSYRFINIRCFLPHLDKMGKTDRIWLGFAFAVLENHKNIERGSFLLG